MRIAFPLILALAVPAVAQTSVIVPSGAATKMPMSWAHYPFYGTSSTTLLREGRVQYCIDTFGISVPGMNIKSLQHRRPSNLINICPVNKYNVTVICSVSPNGSSAATATYASNHGAKPVGVFKGVLNLPQASRGPAWPDPWNAGIKFNTPFPYATAMGKTLVIEITCSMGTATSPWYLEATRPNSGARATTVSPTSCYHSGNACPCSMSYRMPVVGGTWMNRYNGYPLNTPSLKASVLTLGTKGPGGSYGGKLLPFDIASLGIPTIQPRAQTCFLANDILFTIPLTYTPGTSSASLASANFNIPNTPVLGNAVFFTQPLSLDTDPVTKMPAVHSGWGSKWTIGDGKGAPATMVYRTGNNAQTSGYLRKQWLTTLKLNG